MNKNKIFLLILTLCLGVLTSAPEAQEKVRLVAIMNTSPNFVKALDGIRTELGNGYDIKIVDVEKQTDLKAISKISERSSAMILMDSKAVALVREIQKVDSFVESLPKFVIMTLQVQNVAEGLSHCAGVRFEVPAYSLVTNFRIVSKNEFSRVGVFYRKQFAPMIEEARRQLAREKIEIVGICLDSDNPSGINENDALRIMNKNWRTMRKENDVDVFWMLPDNVIVNAQSVTSFWVGKVKAAKKPILAPLENLASLQIGMGVFAANPDYMELGTQTAGLILSVLEDGTNIDEVGFEPLTSINTVLNTEVAKEIGWQIRTDKLARVKTVLKKQ